MYHQPGINPSRNLSPQHERFRHSLYDHPARLSIWHGLCITIFDGQPHKVERSVTHLHKRLVGVWYGIASLSCSEVFPERLQQYRSAGKGWVPVLGLS